MNLMKVSPSPSPSLFIIIFINHYHYHYIVSRKERFCGWYHTHPFDLDVNSHCYLSSTDISTQLLWQRNEDPHGNPFLAIVIDPLRYHHHYYIIISSSL